MEKFTEMNVGGKPDFQSKLLCPRFAPLLG
jgi:hypothetical protein